MDERTKAGSSTGRVRIVEQGLGLYIIAGHLYAYLHLQKSDYLCSISCSLLVFNYRWGLSHCWAIWPLYGFKTRYNRLRSTICKYGSNHVSGLMHQIFILYCVFLLCRASTSDSEDKDLDSGNYNYLPTAPECRFVQCTTPSLFLSSFTWKAKYKKSANDQLVSLMASKTWASFISILTVLYMTS